MGQRSAVKSGTTQGFLLPDLHGNAVVVVNATETAGLAARRYDAWGQTLDTYDSGGGFNLPWRHQGRLDVSPDPANPLYEAGARYYNPGVGIFSQLDSVTGSAANPLTMNRYLYALANPATLVDPSGHMALATHTGSCPIGTDCTPRARQTAALAQSRADRIYRSIDAVDRNYVFQIDPRIAEADRLTRAGQMPDPIGQLGGFFHTTLGAAGAVPVVCAPANLLDALLYAGEGDFFGAGLAFAGVLPVVGDAVDVGRLGVRVAAPAAVVTDDIFKANRIANPLLTAGKDLNQWGGPITSRVTQTEEIFYRVWGGGTGRVGQWLTPVRPDVASVVRQGLSLPPSNTATFFSEVRVPAGTRIQEGVAGALFGQPGGLPQVQLMPKIDPTSFGPGQLITPLLGPGL